jgi:phospholipid/cholesterol/gamma-HCH transport system ATP-binding protein
MGMLFQFGALFTDLSVFDNVAFPLREHTDLPEDLIRDVVLMKLNAVGLRGRPRPDAFEISGGMARRVALARAIALDPELVMYDEPFAGLDPISLGTAARLIRQLNDTMGLTSIVVSHDLDETFQIADQWSCWPMAASPRRARRMRCATAPTRWCTSSSMPCQKGRCVFITQARRWRSGL